MPQLLITSLVSFCATLITLLLICWLSKTNSSIFINSQIQTKQTIHRHHVSRIGGLGIYIGLFFSLFVNMEGDPTRSFMLSITPLLTLPFLTGFLEDISGKIRAKTRFILTIFNSTIAIYILGISIIKIDIPGIDSLLVIPLIAFVFTVFAISGLTNAFNIIDGVNGLASMTAIMALSAISYIAYLQEDISIVFLSVPIIASSLAFFVLNYPGGRIFLGDGGAYLFGFAIGMLSIYTAHVYPVISPWFFIAINIYPITETLFTIWRRGLHQKKNPLLSDRLHLHSLLHRRVLYKTTDSLDAEMIAANSKVAPYLWLLNLIALVPALIWWHSTPIMVITCLIYIACYLWHYYRLARFRSPSWLL
jgi:UDP-N-acetylmuramyl pentapeptide phosphotransferase/UDP-N-acetylglucosamine-1-phosphate transferase